MSTSALNPGNLALNELSGAVEALLQGFDDRSIRIFRDRIVGLKTATTLEEFGQEFGLTRERIRQIEVGIRKKIEKRLTFPNLSCIAKAANSFTEHLGIAFPLRYLEELNAFAKATSCSPDLLAILIWQGGPYAVSGTCVFRQPLFETKEFLESLLPTARVLEPQEDVKNRLAQHGLNVLFCAEILEYFDCKIFNDGMVACWRGSLADKASLILTNQGSPMTREEISALIPDEHSVRTLGNYLFADKRFARVNLTQFALAEWGMPGYKGIVPELTEEIGKRGGEATLAQLREALVPKFGISERSIISYLNSPFFARTVSGGFRVRREDEALEIQSQPEFTRSCFSIDERWAYRLQVDAELIRGSGRNVPTAFAAGIDLVPGEVKLYESSYGEFRISWVGAQPSLGSIRLLIEQFGLAIGDWLYLRPDGDLISFFPVRLSQLMEIVPEDSLFIQCCPNRNLEDPTKKAQIAKAIGLRDHDSWMAIGRRLLERRENTLHDLVPEVDDEPSHDSIDELFAFLGTEVV